MDAANLAKAIKARVSMRDAIDLYAPIHAPRYNRIPCPIHRGDNYNLSFTDSVYHCFVCGSSGDVINFVQHIFGIDFCAATEKINRDFGLNLPVGRKPTLREQRDIERKAREARQREEKRRAEEYAYNTLYNALWDEYARLDINKRLFKPKSPDEPINDLYAEAVKKIDYQGYLIDTLL